MFFFSFIKAGETHCGDCIMSTFQKRHRPIAKDKPRKLSNVWCLHDNPGTPSALSGKPFTTWSVWHMHGSSHNLTWPERHYDAWSARNLPSWNITKMPSMPLRCFKFPEQALIVHMLGRLLPYLELELTTPGGPLTCLEHFWYSWASINKPLECQ